MFGTSCDVQIHTRPVEQVGLWNIHAIHTEPIKTYFDLIGLSGTTGTSLGLIGFTWIKVDTYEGNKN